MITQEELGDIGFELEGTFGTITRYRFKIKRDDLWKSDTYNNYYYEEDSDPDGEFNQRLYGILNRGMDHTQPTYEDARKKTSWSTVEELEESLKIYLKKDLTN